jgi:tellurite resistance protein TerC
VFIGLSHGWGDSSLYITAYLLEKSLSVDNLFVMMAIFSSFAIPAKYQHRVLYYGIIGALVLRLIFISAGTALIQIFGSFALAAFALFVLWSAWKMWQSMRKHQDAMVDYSNHWSVRKTQKIIPIYPHLDGHKFFTKQNAKHFATPLFLCLVAIEFADVMFAFDSVPAVMTITQEPFLVYTSNVFAILGLRSLFFLLTAAVRYLKHLEKAIIAILAFIGIKMLLDVTGVIEHLNPAWNLLVVGVLLAIGVIASIVDKNGKPNKHLGTDGGA